MRLAVPIVRQAARTRSRGAGGRALLPGARLGPRAIRQASANLCFGRVWPWNIDPFDTLAVIDWGDVVFPEGNWATMSTTLEAHATTIVGAGHSFLIRVGANVHLLSHLGVARQDRGLVYLWPNEVLRKRQAPLVLRLIEFQGARGKVYLVTNVLSEGELSWKQAGKLYRLRWGVELQFRAFKQTFGRGKLRNRTAENALVELHWSLVGLWLIQLYAVKEQIKIDSPPEASSVATALSIVQDAMRNWSAAITKPTDLARRLSQATKDDYQRTGSKRSRYLKDYKDKPSATKPVILKANKAQRQAFKALAAAA